MAHAMQKRVFGYLRTAKIQISLHIHPVWLGPLLSANRIFATTDYIKEKQMPALRKHAYSNILKILPPKNEKISVKKS